MSAAHLAVRPIFALQLATRVEAYAAAMRPAALDASQVGEVTAETGSLLAIMELARPVPAVWTEWGRFVLANAEFGLQKLKHRSDASLLDALREVDASADALISRAVEWALLEPHAFPVAVEVAQAFIEWEAARKVAYGLRLSATGLTIGRNAGALRAADAPHLREWQSSWDAQCATLLVRAVRALEGRAEDPS